MPRGLPIPVSVGLCVPQACTIQDFNEFKPYMVSAVNGLLPELFAGIKGFDVSTQIGEGDLHFANSYALNREVTQADAFEWFTAFVLVMFAAGAVVASFARSYFQRQAAQRQAERREKLAANTSLNRESAETAEALLFPDEQEEDHSSRKKRRKPKKARTMERVVKCFSLQQSLGRLFTSRVRDEDDEELSVLDGVRVLACVTVILGNSYFYMLKGPLQNMAVIQEWMSSFLFSVVLSAEHVVDIFFWLTAFLSTYLLLVKPAPSWGWLYLNRVVRLLPLYAFTMFFFWKFLVLYGGDGPLFYQYHENTQCQRYWFYHLTFLNNLIPWSDQDTCLPWTWYLANDFQFFLLVPFLVGLYADVGNRKKFYYTVGGILGANTLIQTVVILANSLSVSYFTYQDEYWTVYYVKPYSRLPVFLIGVVAGASYYSFKREEEPHRIGKILEALQQSPVRAASSALLGMLLMTLMISFMQVINNAPNEGSQFTNLIYLLTHRPLFIAGFSMLVFPVLVAREGTPCAPLKNFLGHSFWGPFSRLSYGALLSHGIWMQFRDFNTERGTWACGFDAFLFFLAYVAFSFLFSFLTAMAWEQPIASLWHDFVVHPRD